MEEHRADRLGELAAAHEGDHPARRVGAVASDAPAHDAVESHARAHRADEQHVAAVIAREGAVVEADDVHAASVARERPRTASLAARPAVALAWRRGPSIQERMARSPFDVVVLGAGVAGLAAAGALGARGLRVALVDARPRLGGRVHTIVESTGAPPIEIGAEFLHGSPPRVVAIARAAGLAIDETRGEHWRSKRGALAKTGEFHTRLDAAMKPVVAMRGADRSLDDVLAAARGLSREARALARSFVEGFEAADARVVSARWLAAMMRASPDETTRIARLERGWGAVVEWLRDRLDPATCTTFLSTIATSVTWRAGRVVVRGRSATGFALDPFVARAAIVALPLGVLQASGDATGAVRFEPPLADRAAAMAKMASGDVARVVLRFREPIDAWPDVKRGEPMARLRGMAFLHAPGATIETWWTALPRRAPLVTAWTGGTRARELLGMGETNRVARVVASLASSLGRPRGDVESRVDAWWTHDWSRDPFARGAYAYALVGGASAADALAAPVDATLFFAGEHVAGVDACGTVHGAIDSGERAARELLASRDSAPVTRAASTAPTLRRRRSQVHRSARTRTSRARGSTRRS